MNPFARCRDRVVRLSSAVTQGRLRLAWRFGSAPVTIALVCLAVFVVQQVTDRVPLAEPYRFGTALTHIFGLSWPLFSAGFFWQPVSYIFLHGSWLHLGLNMLSLLLFGGSVEALVGRGRFWRLFLISGVVGGLGWMAFEWFEPLLWARVQSLPGDFWREVARRWAGPHPSWRSGVCIGASAGVFGLIGAFAALCPRRELIVLLFFVIPIRMRARQVALLLMFVTLGELIAGHGQVAYTAHLCGGLAGYLWARIPSRY